MCMSYHCLTFKSAVSYFECRSPLRYFCRWISKYSHRILGLHCTCLLLGTCIHVLWFCDSPKFVTILSLPLMRIILTLIRPMHKFISTAQTPRQKIASLYPTTLLFHLIPQPKHLVQIYIMYRSFPNGLLMWVSQKQSVFYSIFTFMLT